MVARRRLHALDVQARLATSFKQLHGGSAGTLCLVNVCDADGVAMVLRAADEVGSKGKPLQGLATASYGMAMLANTTDDDLTWADNGPLCKAVGEQVHRLTSTKGLLPLSVDIQDGYGDDLESVMEDAIMEAGAVGINLEDTLRPEGPEGSVTLMPIEEAARRVHRARTRAEELGIPDFVINARTDAVLLDGSVDEAVRRGRAYLAAGANVIYVWGGPQRGLRTEEVKHVVASLGGQVNLKLQPGGLTLDELTTMGVARASLCPYLFKQQVQGGEESVKKCITSLLQDGRL